MVIDVSVIVPCFNEAGNLPELVARLEASARTRPLVLEIVLVDDGSRDRTAEVIRELEVAHPSVRGVFHDTNRGIPAGWASGLSVARGEYACLIDADLQYQPEDVCRLFDEIRHSRADLVQGYRRSLRRLKDSRYILSKGLNLLLNLLFPLDLRDAKSGFVLARRAVMQHVLAHRLRYHYFQTFIGVSAVAKGYRVREIEVLFGDRLVGTSFMSRMPVLVVTRSFIDLARAVWEFRLRPSGTDDALADILAREPAAAHTPALRRARRAWLGVYFWLAPLHKWTIGRRTVRDYDHLQRTQWLTPDAVRRLQEHRLRDLVHHAYHHVPYYRQLLDDHGVRPEDVQSLDDLRHLPMLSKDTVREHLYLDLLSDNHDKKAILRVTTSGSTGEPFTCFVDRRQLEMRWASTLRGQEWTGYRFGDRHVRLWHQTLGLSWSQVLRERVDAWLSRRLFIPAFDMSDRTLAGVVRRIRAYRPALMDGYAESFALLTRYLAASGGDAPRPGALMSSAQGLPASTRDAAERAFGCRVFDKYGSREFSGIAYECDAHQGLHICAESFIVELVKDGRPALPGEVGEVVITDLNNRCMPFIRYRIGDLAVAVDNTRSCPCGRGLPRLDRIEGRVQSIVVGGNGRYVPGTFFAHLFKDYAHLVRHYRIEQHRRGAIDLLIVRGSRFTQDGFDTALRELRSCLGHTTAIAVQFVDAIPLERTGKRQPVVSYVPVDFQHADTSTTMDAGQP